MTSTTDQTIKTLNGQVEVALDSAQDYVAGHDQMRDLKQQLKANHG